jgi:hypothetical protein
MGTEAITADQLVGENGAMQPGWQGLIFAGEEDGAMKDDLTLANVKDLRGMATTIVEGQKTIGKLSGGRDFTILPNEHSTEVEINDHFKKLGRPDDVAGYELDKVQMPEGIEKDEKFMAKMAEASFAAGVSKSQLLKQVAGYTEYVQELKGAIATEEKLANDAENKALRGKLGSAYDASMKTAFTAVDALAGPISAEFAAGLKKDLPYDANAAQLFIKIGQMIEEDGGLKVPVGEQQFTPADALTEINKIMADPYYATEQPTGKPRNRALHDELVQKVKALFEAKNATSA